MKTFLKILITCLIISSLNSCAKKEEPSLKFALSKGYPVSSYQNYYHWVHRTDSTISVDDMYNQTVKEAIEALKDYDALIVTGGADIYPGNYGKEADTSRCGGFDLKRDTLEFALIKKALDLKMPIFGICRGQQIINISLGGSLIIDIPTDVKDTSIKHRMIEWRKCYHDVNVLPGTKFSWATNVTSGNVTSNHHQAIDVLAQNLRVCAKSADGIIEAVEWKEPENKSFLMAVQWHPERMKKDNPLSQNLLELIISEAKRYQETTDDL